ncbi:division/cell wall cluster transcriptional repressor MraZ [Marinicella rhabdoformis]|uniref:division/cell wall cluster transcriptional repressor MraZ n=1 Tax=Marinicella rhabdoformis TaxID=2580566 RepID=UPI0015CFC93C
MFYGEVALNLDVKGRLAIPSMYREPIAEACQNKLVLTYNAYENDSLWLYPEAEWEQVRNAVMALSTFDPMHRNLQRRLVGSAYHLSPDKGSRVLLPITLRQVASMEKRVVMLGLGSKFEIWNEDALMKQRHQVPAMNGEVSDAMKQLVL